MRPIHFPAAVLALALLAAACGDTGATTTSDVPATESPTTAPPTTTTVAPTTTPPAEGTEPTEPPVTSTTAVAAPVTPPSDYAGFAAQPTACGAAAPSAPRDLFFAAPVDQQLDPTATVTATIATSCGDITVELFPGVAPETVNSFVFLAGEGYFDGTVSHRVLPGFVIQAGDPTGTGRGGPGYVIADEFPAPDFTYDRGVLAMANAGLGTTGSQFFIMLGAAPLPPQFSVFGEVTAGFDVLDAIAVLPLGLNAFGERSVPLETLYLERVEVTVG